jgi:hypothetical protein
LSLRLTARIQNVPPFKNFEYHAIVANSKPKVAKAVHAGPAVRLAYKDSGCLIIAMSGLIGNVAAKRRL